MTPQADKIVDEWLKAVEEGDIDFDDIADLKRRFAESLTEAAAGWVSAIQVAVVTMERTKVSSTDTRNELWVAIQLLKGLLPPPPKDTGKGGGA
jgi:hypothetical protein